MKKEFKHGDYCLFHNEEIPRILDILRSNGWKVWINNVPDGDYVVMTQDGFISNPGDPCKSPFYKLSELSRHDFMVIALRLEEGMGILFNETTTEQRKHIQDSFVELGVKCDPMPEHLEKYCYLFSDGEWMSCQPYHIKKAISYLDWCKRLCIEPIGIEPTAEPVFDPSKPFEVSNGHGWGQATISGKTGAFTHYVGKSKGGLHVIQTPAGFVEYLDIRNTEEFNASMLEVGEWMEVTEVGPYENWVIQKKNNGYWYCPEYAKSIVIETIKGRRVNVEIKVVETKKTKQ